MFLPPNCAKGGVAATCVLHGIVALTGGASERLTTQNCSSNAGAFCPYRCSQEVHHCGRKVCAYVPGTKCLVPNITQETRSDEIPSRSTVGLVISRTDSGEVEKFQAIRECNDLVPDISRGVIFVISVCSP